MARLIKRLNVLCPNAQSHSGHQFRDVRRLPSIAILCASPSA